jgi:hypothetical protein
MNKKIFLILSLVVFVFGFLLLDTLNAEYIINLFSLFLHKQLNIEFWKIGLYQTGLELILFSSLALLFILFYNTFPKQVLLISFSGIILFFLGSVLYYSVNIPINTPGNDDYWVFLNFLNHYSSTKNIGEIFNQFDDQREIFRRLMAVILFNLNAFNFKTIIFFANICLIGIVCLFYKSISLSGWHKDFLFLILIIIVFQFQYYDATLWASAGTAAVCGFFFTFSCFYFLSKPSRYFALALLFPLLYITINIVGFVTVLIGSIMLLQMKNKKGFLIWIATSLLVFILYFHNFTVDKEHHFSFVAQELSFNKLQECLMYSFIFLGSSMQLFHTTSLPIGVGILLWFFFLFLSYKKYFLKNSPIYFSLLFLLSVSLLIPICREEKSLQTPLAIRYSLFSIMAICCSILSIAELISTEQRKKYFYTILSIALIYHLSANIFFLPEAVIRKEKLIIMIDNFKQTEKLKPVSCDLNQPVNETTILRQSIEKKFYKIPE